MFKFVILVGCVALAHGLLDSKQYGKKIADLAVLLHEKCVLYTGATNDMIKEVQNGNFDGTGSTTIKRYNACLWIETGIVDINLNIHLERMTELEPEHFHGKGVKLNSKCIEDAINSGATTTLDKLWNATQCSYKADPENFIMF